MQKKIIEKKNFAEKNRVAAFWELVALPQTNNFLQMALVGFSLYPFPKANL